MADCGEALDANRDNMVEFVELLTMADMRPNFEKTAMKEK
jgi:hypothetical protein